VEVEVLGAVVASVIVSVAGRKWWMWVWISKLKIWGGIWTVKCIFILTGVEGVGHAGAAAPNVRSTDTRWAPFGLTDRQGFASRLGFF
jgi:hypothetical protein